MRSTARVDVGHFAAVAVERPRSTLPRTPRRGERMDGVGAEYLRIPTPALLRSVEFYSRLFELDVVETARCDAGRSVLMAAGSLRLSIQELRRGEHASAAPLRFSVAVDDFDRARARIWDLGIVPSRGCAHEPQPDRPWRRARSFAIRDPGGNEIEVVERAPR